MRIANPFLIAAGFVAIVAFAGFAVGQDVADVTITTPFDPGERPTTANFYYNDRAVGRGHDAFETILQRMDLLPEGTSIVWGPDYRRCGSCRGSEPGCLPAHLHPKIVAEIAFDRGRKKVDALE